MAVKVNINDLRIINGDLVGDLEYFPYGIYLIDYIFGEGDVVEQNSIETWIYMDENKLFDVADVC
jgi:hypothetical protein